MPKGYWIARVDVRGCRSLSGLHRDSQAGFRALWSEVSSPRWRVS